jgi:hypothetical protein
MKSQKMRSENWQRCLLFAEVFAAIATIALTLQVHRQESPAASAIASMEKRLIGPVVDQSTTLTDDSPSRFNVLADGRFVGIRLDKFGRFQTIQQPSPSTNISAPGPHDGVERLSSGILSGNP